MNAPSFFCTGEMPPFIRYDTVVVRKRLFDATGDGDERELALARIEPEPDAKYRKKYARDWR
jgi:hypothetical protein